MIPPRAAGKTTPALGSHTLSELDLDAFEEHSALALEVAFDLLLRVLLLDAGRDSDEKEMELTRCRRI